MFPGMSPFSTLGNAIATGGAAPAAAPFPWMAAAGVATAALPILGGMLGKKASKDGAKAAARYAAHQAYINKISSNEQMRRMRLVTSRMEGRNRSQRAKSGVTAEGTPALVMQENAELAAIDQAFAAWQAEENQTLLKMRARAARKGAKIQGDASMIQGMSSAAGMLYNTFG